MNETNTSPKDAAEPFVMPKLHNGMFVDIDSSLEFTRPVLGMVIQAKKHSASILAWTREGPWSYADCRHKDDPRNLRNPNWAADQPKNCAYFRLSERERLLQAVLKAFPAMKEEVAAMRKENASLADKAVKLHLTVEKLQGEIAILKNSPDDAPDPRRRRGPSRPRNQPRTEPARTA
mgnify:CR=1 FL=1|tara:strand:- start:273 stop:803 length:531 start_codon:yes stop_codon:yes gene_type:complete